MLIKRSFTLSGHRTSVALEPEFWAALASIAAEQNVALSTFVTTIDQARTPEIPLTSQLRVIALTSAQRKAGQTAPR